MNKRPNASIEKHRPQLDKLSIRCAFIHTALAVMTRSGRTDTTTAVFNLDELSKNLTEISCEISEIAKALNTTNQK